MVDSPSATHDEALGARVVRTDSLVYGVEAQPDVGTSVSETPKHTQLVHLVNRLAFVQDDTHCLVLVDLNTGHAWNRSLTADGSVDAEALADAPLDLEACTIVPDSDQQRLIAFGSGADSRQEWVVIIDWSQPGDDPWVIVHEVPEFFEVLRDVDAPDDTHLNLEGALFVDNDTLRVFFQHTPNEGSPTDAPDLAADVSWTFMSFYLKDPTRADPPPLTHVRHHDLGTLDDGPLLFSDAHALSSGALLYAATTATNGDAGPAVLGVMTDDDARYTPLRAEDGTLFRGKIEGLRPHPSDPRRVRFVIDADKMSDASRIYEAELTGPWAL